MHKSRSKQFKPMLACLMPEGLDKFPMMVSYKLDGIRCVIRDGVPLTRKLKPIPNKFISNTLTALNLPNLDGEFMLPGCNEFAEVSSAVMSQDGEPDFRYHVFDIDSNDPYIIRYNALLSAVREVSSINVVAVRQWVAESMPQVTRDMNDAEKLGHEGLMLRCPASPYKYGRSTVKEAYLLKLKPFDDAEAVIISVIEQMRNNNEVEHDALGYAKRSTAKAGMTPAGTLGGFVVAMPRDGAEPITFELGPGRTNHKQRDELWACKEHLIGKLAKFRYQGLGAKGRPRFPIFLGIRDEDDT